jgi:hypothetical protein
VAAYSDPSGRLLGECHGLMHTVERECAGGHDVALENLMSYLPQTNEPGCSAGFAHGLVTGVAPQIDLGDPAASAAVCDETDTRHRRYSCIHGFGHAFMRLVREDLPTALELCSSPRRRGTRLLPGRIPRLLVRGDRRRRHHSAGDPRRRPTEALRRAGRGIRAPVLVPRVHRRTPGRADLLGRRHPRPLRRARRLQRRACITAASVVGPPDPRVQLSFCAEFEGEDAVSCIRGTKMLNLIVSTPEDHVALIRGCDGFEAQTRLDCYCWLGRVLVVFTDGEFERYGCPAAPDARAPRLRPGRRRERRAAPHLQLVGASAGSGAGARSSRLRMRSVVRSEMAAKPTATQKAMLYPSTRAASEGC